MKSQKITLYAYFNIQHPMVAWEVALGRIKSSCDIGNEGFGLSLWQYSNLSRLAKTGKRRAFIDELKLEQVRQQYHQNKVSRLQGVYFFRTEHDAHAALNRWGIKSQHRIVSEVDFYANNLSEVDSE
jgi:hypothetical protein